MTTFAIQQDSLNLADAELRSVKITESDSGTLFEAILSFGEMRLPLVVTMPELNTGGSTQIALNNTQLTCAQHTSVGRRDLESKLLAARNRETQKTELLWKLGQVLTVPPDISPESIVDKLTVAQELVSALRHLHAKGDESAAS